MSKQLPLPSSSTATTNPVSMVLDVDRFSGVTEGKPSAMRSLAGRYVRTMMERIAQIETSLYTGDLVNVRQIAHQAGGSSAMIGVTGLATLLKKLENCAAGGSLPDAKTFIRDLHRSFGELIDFFLARHWLTAPHNPVRKDFHSVIP